MVLGSFPPYWGPGCLLPYGPDILKSFASSCSDCGGERENEKVGGNREKERERMKDCVDSLD